MAAADFDADSATSPVSSRVGYHLPWWMNTHKGKATTSEGLSAGVIRRHQGH